MGKVEFVEEKISGSVPWRQRKIGEVISSLSKGDRIVTPELSRLGRSLLDCLEILKTAKEKGLVIYSIKENLELNGSDPIAEKIYVTMLGLFAELGKDFISLRTKEALAARKASGLPLGRPKGIGKSRLDPHREEIEALLKVGSPQVYIARKFGCSPGNLSLWIRKHGIDPRPAYN
jgi:DNA invertase Pin-like site-specific DNA recombinase